MARLKSGVLPTPHKDRLKLYREELERTGGHRLIADLNPEAHTALRTIMARDNVTQKDAAQSALISFAGDKRRRPKV